MNPIKKFNPFNFWKQYKKLTAEQKEHIQYALNAINCYIGYIITTSETKKKSLSYESWYDIIKGFGIMLDDNPKLWNIKDYKQVEKVLHKIKIGK